MEEKQDKDFSSAFFISYRKKAKYPLVDAGKKTYIFLEQEFNSASLKFRDLEVDGGVEIRGERGLVLQMSPADIFRGPRKKWIKNQYIIIEIHGSSWQMVGRLKKELKKILLIKGVKEVRF